MPPRKAKLHDSTGRLRSINSSYVNNSNSSNSSNRNAATTSNSSANRSNNTNATENRSNGSGRNEVITSTPNSSMETPAMEQFELELYWCIQTLENSLSSGKLNAKQAQDADKTLRSLKSNSQPMVKKRQLMQSAFGDYRKKMADEEKKLRVGNTSIQFIEGASKESNTAANKGHFVKKSFTSTLGTSNFKFNFPIDAMQKLSIEQQNQSKDSAKSNESTSPTACINDKVNAESNAPNGNACTMPTTTHSNPFIQSKLVTSDNAFKFNFTVDCD